MSLLGITFGEPAHARQPDVRSSDLVTLAGMRLTDFRASGRKMANTAYCQSEGSVR